MSKEEALKQFKRVLANVTDFMLSEGKYENKALNEMTAEECAQLILQMGHISVEIDELAVVTAFAMRKEYPDEYKALSDRCQEREDEENNGGKSNARPF